MRLEQRVERRWMLKSSVAFSWACLLRRSSPFTITSFLLSSLTPARKQSERRRSMCYDGPRNRAVLCTFDTSFSWGKKKNVYSVFSS